MDGVDGWTEFTKTKDAAALAEHLAPDVVFRSPILFPPVKGREKVLMYLAGGASVLGGDDFRYTRIWRDGLGAAMQFESQIGDVWVNGVDLIELAEEGRIATFTVMVRPLRAVNLLHQTMARHLGVAQD